MKKLQLDEIVEKLQIGSIFGDSAVYFHKTKNEFVDILLEYIDMVEEIMDEEKENDIESIEEALEIDNFSEFEQDDVRLAIHFVLNPEDYVQLNTITEKENHSMMSEFTDVIVDKKYSEELSKIVNKKGSYKEFKNILNLLKLEDKWNDYRALALKQRAIFWCLKNAIDFQE